MNQRRIRTVKCVAAAAFAMSMLSAAWDHCLAGSPVLFRSDTNGWSVAIPEGWRMVPEETCRQLFGPAFSENNLNFDLEAVVADEFTENSMAYPYAVVQVKKYAKYGVNEPLNKEEIQGVLDTLTKSLTELGNADNMVTRLPAHMQGAVSEIRSGEVYVDRDSASLLQATDTEMPGVGKLKQVSLWRCGRKAVVKITFIGTEPDWDQLAPQRNLVMESFQFDTTSDYAGAPSTLVGYGRRAKESGSFWEDMLVDVGVYGIIGSLVLAIGLIGHTVRKLKGKPIEQAGASPQTEEHNSVK